MNFKLYWKKLVFPILALIFTISTGGYLAFMILMVGVIFSLKIFKRKKWLFPMALFLALGFCWIIYQSEAVQTKIEQKESNNESSSFYIRLNDNLGLLKMASDSPVFGFGMETKSFVNKARKYNNDTSSNGWLCTAAANGIIISILFFICLFKGVRRNTIGIPYMYVFSALFFSQCIEYYVYFPIMFMYVYKFKPRLAKK